MKPYRYFFSPQPTRYTINKYVSSFYDKLSERVNVVNHNQRRIGLTVDLLRYAFRTDVMILNWPEDMVHLRFGFIQTLFSVIILLIFRVTGGKVIWVCHNKESHNKRHRIIRKFLRYFFTRISQYIIVHSEDALKYFDKPEGKVFFLNHPVYEDVPRIGDIDLGNGVDVLIWGNITPYKGLSEFIENYRKNKATFQVTIIGKANKEYFNQLTELTRGLNISVKDKFLNDDELAQYFHQSRIILLPYLDSDTFSSGALIHSLSSNKIVIGPAVGNFNDLFKWGACLVYKDYVDLFKIINKCLQEQGYYQQKLKGVRAGISAYYAANSWTTFIDHLLGLICAQTGQQNAASYKILEKHPKQFT